MTTSTSRKSYQDCFDLMEQAINSKGVRVQFVDEGAANHFRLRIHKARVIDREENATMFKADDPMHGISIYDPLVCRIKDVDGKTWLYVEKNSLEGMVVESLGEEEPQVVAVSETITVTKSSLVVVPEPDLPIEPRPTRRV